MAIKPEPNLSPETLRPRIEKAFELSGAKIWSLEKEWDPAKGTPVFTVRGKYTSRGWTEWTQGFQFGAATLQFEATEDQKFLDLGRRKTIEHMASHISHIGVHDHGFNNVSTYGNLWRLAREGKIAATEADIHFYELALKISGAVQAARWTRMSNGSGFIYSFNGPHSLFIDTMRSLRSLALAHRLGHALMGERDQKISLLKRLIEHARATAEYSIYYGLGRDAYDEAGRAAHEIIFNVNDGHYRCPNSQQGYSPFSTWTRGLAWAICGFAEELEFLSEAVSAEELEPFGGKESILLEFEKVALVTANFYLMNACACGVPMWDTGAPNLHKLGDYQNKAADPFNSWEPVDSSAAAIAAQGLLRLGHCLAQKKSGNGSKYTQAGLTIARTLFSEPYLSFDLNHQGLLLHSVYHRPNGWDHIAPGQKVPNGESSMWGDYHLRELGLILLREAKGEPWLRFFGGR